MPVDARAPRPPVGETDGDRIQAGLGVSEGVTDGQRSTCTDGAQGQTACSIIDRTVDQFIGVVDGIGCIQGSR